MALTFWNNTVQFIKPVNTLILNYNRIYPTQKYLLALQLVPSNLRFTKGTRRLNFTLSLKESMRLGFMARSADEMRITRDKMQFWAKNDDRGVIIGLSDFIDGTETSSHEVHLQSDQMQLVRELINQSLPGFVFCRNSDQLLKSEGDQRTIP